MAKDKKSFLLYTDYESLFAELSDEEAGKLIKHVFGYVNDRDPELTERALTIAFIPIKMQLKRDLKKYEGKKEQWSEAGKKSAELRALNKLNERSTESTVVENVQRPSTDSTVNVNVNVNDNVNDNVNVNDINKTKGKEAVPACEISKFIKPSILEVGEYCIERKNGIAANEFFDFYESKGWMIGKNKMKDWKSAVRTWESSRKTISHPANSFKPKEKAYDPRF